MFFDLSNKVVIVTGAGGLLGPYHASALLECGASVILLEKDKNRLISAENKLKEYDKNKIYFYECDVSLEKEVIKIKNQLDGINLSPNVLINNAANNPAMMKLEKSEYTNRLEDLDMSSIQDDIQSSIFSTLVCIKIFGEHMANRNDGSIINVASDLAIQAPDQRVYTASEKIEDVKNFKPISYSLVKSSMLGVTRYVATYWGHKKVRCNTLVPGAVFNNQPKELVKNVKKRVPLQRWADVKDYQGALIFLASDKSSYMTGQELIIDGGRSIW